MIRPGEVLIDCTGTRSVLRNRLDPDPGALVITFLYGEAYDRNEYCKYYKNVGNPYYKFTSASMIPSPCWRSCTSAERRAPYPPGLASSGARYEIASGSRRASWRARGSSMSVRSHRERALIISTARCAQAPLG